MLHFLLYLIHLHMHSMLHIIISLYFFSFSHDNSIFIVVLLRKVHLFSTPACPIWAAAGGQKGGPISHLYVLLTFPHVSSLLSKEKD